VIDCIEARERRQKLKSSGALSADELYEQYFCVLNEIDAVINLSIPTTQYIEENRDTVQYAGFWRRSVAFLIDFMLVIVVGCIGGSFIGSIYGLFMFIVMDDTTQNYISTEAAVLGFVWGIAADCLYFTIQESSSKQATIGKRVLNIIVTNYEFRRIGFAQANARYWGKIVSSLILFLGFLMAAFTKRKQALHDQLAGTLVIVKRL
jgi:uncharacterized RDD family membrane protein YckC